MTCSAANGLSGSFHSIRNSIATRVAGATRRQPARSTVFRPWCDLVPRRYAGTVFSLRVKQPQSIVGRCWNLGQDLSGIALVTFILLKLTRVITWSWWWVLSPMWIGGILVVLALCIVLAAIYREGRSLSSRFQAWRTRDKTALHSR